VHIGCGDWAERVVTIAKMLDSLVQLARFGNDHALKIGLNCVWVVNEQRAFHAKACCRYLEKDRLVRIVPNDIRRLVFLPPDTVVELRKDSLWARGCGQDAPNSVAYVRLHQMPVEG
jgi:hypothetical protein